MPVSCVVSRCKGVMKMGFLCCSDQLVPKAVEGLRGKRVVLISGGWRHTAAADDSGNLYTWGWNKARPPFSL